MAKSMKQGRTSAKTYQRLLLGEASSKDYVASLKKEVGSQRSAVTGRYAVRRSNG